jgi:hypothetical protein
MSELFAWTDNHGFLAWCALWLVWGFIWLGLAAFSISFRIINRILRTIKVCVRGWPPEHLDADGDWKAEAQRPEVKGISEVAGTHAKP